MNIFTKKTVLTAGLACTLGLGAGAFAEVNAPAAPQPPADAPAAPAVAPGKPAARSHLGWRARRLMAIHRRWMRRLSRRLNLDPAQRTQLRHIHAKAMAEIWSARADDQLSREQRSAKIRAAVESGRTELRGILNPDQRARLDRIEERRERRLLGM
jgi:hypothetical protein